MDKFIADFCSLFDDKPSVDIHADTIFKEVPGWDSLIALSLIVMVSNNYGKSIDGEVVRSCSTIRDLYEAISE